MGRSLLTPDIDEIYIKEAKRISWFYLQMKTNEENERIKS